MSIPVRQQQIGIVTQDAILINDLSLTVELAGGARWPRPGEYVSQPVLISLRILHDLSKAAETDDLYHSINYSSIGKALRQNLAGKQFSSLESLSHRVIEKIFGADDRIGLLKVKVAQIASPLHSRAVCYESTRSRGGDRVERDRFLCEDLTCHAMIGVNACEREQLQNIIMNITLEREGNSECGFDFRGLCRNLFEKVGTTSFLTLEALASFVAVEALHYSAGSDQVVVKLAKPDALVFAASSAVEICRTRSSYPAIFRDDPQEPELSESRSSLPGAKSSALPAPTSSSILSTFLSRPVMAGVKDNIHVAAIALGSNVGDRFANIEHALRLLEAPREFSEMVDADLAIIDTSFMYETEPMYVTDQPAFINCACIIETNLQPRELLSVLKKIEKATGRTPSIRNGPRVVDLDIITFDKLVIDTRPHQEQSSLDNLEDQLVIPHPRMAEREFVLRPLNEYVLTCKGIYAYLTPVNSMAPDFIHPVTNKSIESMLRDVLLTQGENSHPIKKVMPFPRYPSTSPSTSLIPSTLKYWTTYSGTSGNVSHPRKTYIMATLNATPDSFSDGSMHNALPAAISYASNSIAAGANIVDIGGYSTRPGADYVSPEEEKSRVVPIIEALRNLEPESETISTVRDCLISVDTFRPEVAKAALLAGANCINDVYGFTGPDYPLTPASAEHLIEMRQIAKDMAVPVILMHSRGDAGSNKDYSMYSSTPTCASPADAVLEGVRCELSEKVDAIVKGRNGLRRWFVIVDPGVGFSKSVKDNLTILRRSSYITTEHPSTELALSRNIRNSLVGFPQLIGTSKKSFLGSILAAEDAERDNKGRRTEPNERGWATAAAVACAVQQGAMIVRVHDVAEMGDVVKVSSALWG